MAKVCDITILAGAVSNPPSISPFGEMLPIDPSIPARLQVHVHPILQQSHGSLAAWLGLRP